MPKLNKRMRKIGETIKVSVSYDVLDALNLLKNLSTVKFVEAVDVSVNLGINPRKSDQIVQGTVLLPKGTGKTVKIAVLASELYTDKAKEAGADIVGSDDLVEEIKSGNINFDVLIATPDMMITAGKLGPILGPRGLMPNPKVGTVTTDVSTVVKNIKKGQVRYRTDKYGIVHCRIGDVKFPVEDLLGNLKALVSELKRVKPSSSKGIYLKKITVSTTMGPGLVVDSGGL